MKIVVKIEGVLPSGANINIGKVVDSPEAAVAFIEGISRRVK